MRKRIPDNSIDLIITSPPYNLGNDFHSNSIRYKSYDGDDMTENEYQKWQLEVLSECYRVLKENGSLWYNHKVRIKDKEIIHPIIWLNKSDFIIKQEIVWNQEKGANVDKRRCFPFSERLWWMTKNKDVKVNNKYNYKDVWDIVPIHNRKDFNHPAIMEKKVVKRIYSLYEDKENLIVLDPFAGVGTTFTPIKYEYDYIGFEKDSKHCETARERLRKVNRNLFQQVQ